MATKPGRCRYCGARALPDRDVCHAHKDVDDQIAFCTRDKNCVAPADMHEPDCPVEIELMQRLGF